MTPPPPPRNCGRLKHAKALLAQWLRCTRRLFYDTISSSSSSRLVTLGARRPTVSGRKTELHEKTQATIEPPSCVCLLTYAYRGGCRLYYHRNIVRPIPQARFHLIVAFIYFNFNFGGAMPPPKPALNTAAAVGTTPAPAGESMRNTHCYSGWDAQRPTYPTESNYSIYAPKIFRPLA